MERTSRECLIQLLKTADRRFIVAFFVIPAQAGTQACHDGRPIGRLAFPRGTVFRLVTLLTLVALGTVPIAQAEDPNTLTQAEKDNGWQLLFDGKTTDGWRGYKSTAMPASWTAESGALLSRHGQYGTTGDIVTKDEYDNFELTLEWKMTKGGNSGIICRATEDGEQPWETGSEYQILDNTGHMDGLNPLASAGACFAVFAPARDVTKPLASGIRHGSWPMESMWSTG